MKKGEGEKIPMTIVTVIALHTKSYLLAFVLFLFFFGKERERDRDIKGHFGHVRALWPSPIGHLCKVGHFCHVKVGHLCHDRAFMSRIIGHFCHIRALCHIRAFCHIRDHDWASERNKGLTTDVIFLDLSKAFDSVPHERLLTKIHAYGIQGPLLSWLRSFLNNRSQRVVLRGHYSSWTSVLSGVPQGTVLGPILFLIYINDISRRIMSNTKLFADDMKVYRLLRDTKKDVEELQKDLIRLESWSNDWQLRFNTDKCEAMRISKKNDYSSPKYHLCGNQLKAVSEVKDLEIYITSNLSWSLQANKCASKANSVLGFIKRTVGPKNPQLFSKLYKSLVRPILEYCSSVWCPHLKKDLNTLEKVQRRASKCALGNIRQDIPYEERLKLLKWPTLEQRRLFLSLTECYKTINRLNGLDPSAFFTFANDFRPLRANHRFKLKLASATLNSFKNSFFVRITDKWNNLPKEIAEEENLTNFKNRLKRHLFRFF